MGYASSLNFFRLRNNRHDSCEVVTRMLYGNVQQIDNIYQPPFPASIRLFHPA